MVVVGDNGGSNNKEKGEGARSEKRVVSICSKKIYKGGIKVYKSSSNKGNCKQENGQYRKGTSHHYTGVTRDTRP